VHSSWDVQQSEHSGLSEDKLLVVNCVESPCPYLEFREIRQKNLTENFSSKSERQKPERRKTYLLCSKWVWDVFSVGMLLRVFWCRNVPDVVWGGRNEKWAGI
jgi:hypothetical protein